MYKFWPHFNGLATTHFKEPLLHYYSNEAFHSKSLRQSALVKTPVLSPYVYHLFLQ